MLEEDITDNNYKVVITISLIGNAGTSDRGVAVHSNALQSLIKLLAT